MRRFLLFAPALLIPALCLSAFLLASPIQALDPGPNDVYVRVVDVGSGLCAVAEIPGEHYMVYDAGHWQGNKCIEAVREIVDTDEIDLLILSHSDSDHLGDADEILHEYQVRQIIRTGFLRWDTATWRHANNAISEEVEYGAAVTNLQSVDLVPGTQIALGDATVTLIAGWGEWVASGPTASEKRNAISIVAQLEYRDRSVLFTGDTVGRRKSDPDSACKDAAKIMVDRHNAGTVTLKSDVIIAPHHGGNTGTRSVSLRQSIPNSLFSPPAVCMSTQPKTRPKGTLPTRCR